MTHAVGAWRECMLSMDIKRACTIWNTLAPHLEPCTDHHSMAITLHVCRTQESFFPVDKRFYSHRWLLDQGLTSFLPDHLKPRADRMYPKQVRAVGVAARGKAGPEACGMITGRMMYAWQDCEANGDTAKEIVEPQMQRARFQERKALMLPNMYDDWEVPMDWRPV